MIRIRLAALDADVIVAGAGPAGAAAAADLARAGVRVIVVDAARFPRDKVCGDLVGPVAMAELERLGVAAATGFARTNPVRMAALFINGRCALQRDFPTNTALPLRARVIPRRMLDAWIVAEARRAGARLLEGRRVLSYAVEPSAVTVRVAFSEASGRASSQAMGHAANHDTMTLRARVLIGADGSNSVVARQLRGRALEAPERVVSMRAYFEGVNGAEDRVDVHVGAACFPGYYWVFPAGAGRANVGLGLAQETLPAQTSHLRDRLRLALETDPALADRLHGARIVGRLAGWPLAIYDPRLPIVAERVLLVGDAANLINPVNGEGIQAALLSGRWAAEALFEAMRGGDFSAPALEARYAARVHAALDAPMALSRFLVQCIRNTALAPLWLATLNTIAERANTDGRYSDIAAGIMAGVAPMGAGVNAQVMVATLEQALWQVGLSAAAATVQGPSALVDAGRASVRFGAGLLGTVVRHPVLWARWSLQTLADAAQVAGAVGRRVRY